MTRGSAERYHLIVSNTTLPLPAIRIRGRSFMALVVVPESPFDAWLTALDQQMRRSAGFFAGRPVVVNLAAIGEEEDHTAVLDALDARELKIIGIEGADAGQLRGTKWEATLIIAPAREGRADRIVEIPEPEATSEPEPAVSPKPETAPSLLVNRPVRSGQSIVFEDGDVTVIGPVSSGAEIIAGGSIHIYGTLRGRAIAGLLGRPDARIFCRKLAAELLAIDGLYRTADHWGDGLHGKAVQIWLDDKTLRLAALD
ncbi:MAG TPA: septum site-determining protein MinC [Acidiphilium sp.]